MKMCYFCKEIKSLDQFNKNRSKKDGLNTYCRKCMKSVWKKHYDKNPKKYNVRSKSNRIKLKEQFKNLKSVLCCSICGETHPATLDFHHRNPNEKEINISNAARSYGEERLKKEIDKCDVLCSNCHRKLHWNSELV